MDFFTLINIFFPTIYDVKYLMTAVPSLTGGLQKVADSLDIARVGPQHQAGSDALLTAATFFKMKRYFFAGHIDDAKYKGIIFGLNSTGSSLIR
jgi:CCR4-NOT transcription complex subunit 7/8